jgi:hypothetical protein
MRAAFLRHAGANGTPRQSAMCWREGRSRGPAACYHWPMPRKKPPPTKRAAEQADFKSWLADAVAALQREHNVNPGIIPVRVWRRLFIQGRSPQKAADQAAVSAYNARPAADRLRGRKR